MTPLPPETEPFPHVMCWDRLDRQGQSCEIIGRRSTISDVQVRFEDGFTAIVKRASLRRKPPNKDLIGRKTG